MKLFYIGDDFYADSGTMMSSIYHEEKAPSGNYYRSDWGKVNLALQGGDEVHIRQATDKEMLWAHKHLATCKR